MHILRLSNRACLIGFRRQVGDDALHLDLLLHALDGLASRDLLDFGERVLLNELIDADETTADFHSDQVASSNLHEHTLCAEPIVAL